MKQKVKKPLYRVLCTALALTVVFQLSIPTIYAAPKGAILSATSGAKTESLKDQLSKNGNVVTEYVNEEDQLLKTIIWAKGVTPPKMGGQDSDFKKQLTYDKDGKVSYIDYIAPYIPGNGWYDVNKSKNFEQADMNLCFAAAASNSLHWWMDRNAAYIDRYLAMHPDDPQIQKLNGLRHSFENQQKSGVYDIFLRQFANKPDGYWPDLLQDQFINGYYLKANGGTNGSPADIDKIMQNGPDKNGGFFFEVFETNLLTQRRYYDNGFDAINRELKELFLNGDNVLMNYRVGPKNHVVTLWGAEFDQNGNICAVYYSDSDDEASQGMMRFRLLNVNGKAVVTTKVDGMSNSIVECLQILSTGTSQWENYFKADKKVLDLVWSDTELVYNGQVQAPTVSATNIEAGDNITLSVEGGKTDAGVYTATAVLKGPAADQYALPTEHTHTFKIKKAPAPQIVYPSASALQYGQKLTDSILSGGSTAYGSFFWKDAQIVPAVNNSGYMVQFTPSEATQHNYEPLPNSNALVSVAVDKATPTVTLDVKVQHTEDSNAVTFLVDAQPVGYGEIPTGTVKLEIRDANGKPAQNAPTEMLLENGKATAVWNHVPSGTYTAKSTYLGNDNYKAASSAQTLVDVQKQAQDTFEISPIASKTYGDAAFVLESIGGSGKGKVSFESSDPGMLSITGNTAVIHKAGTVTITATKAGDEIYQEAKASYTLVISPKALTVTAENKLHVMQGESMPLLTYTVAGLVNGDQFENPVLTASVANTNTPGEYEIFIQGGSLTNAESYAVTYVNGILSIEEKELPPVPTPNPTPNPTPTPNPSPADPQQPATEENTTLSSQEMHKPDAAQASTKPVGEEIDTADKNNPTDAVKPTQEATEASASVSTETTTTEENAPESQNESTEHPMMKWIVGVLALLVVIAVILVLVFRKRKHTENV